MEKRFEARKIKATRIREEDMAKIWGVYDLANKGWYPKFQAGNMYDAMLVADSLNNGHLKP